jgi:hypothetical protein
MVKPWATRNYSVHIEAEGSALGGILFNTP